MACRRDDDRDCIFCEQFATCEELDAIQTREDQEDVAPSILDRMEADVAEIRSRLAAMQIQLNELLRLETAIRRVYIGEGT